MRAALLDNTLKSRAATSQSANVPAPTGGWNTRDALAEMPPLDAYVLDNLFPRYGQCVLRGGSTNFATAMTGTVKTLCQYAPAGGTRKLFAVTNSGIYDITAGGTIGAVVQALTNGYWNSLNISNSAGTAYLWGCNGTDTPKMWDGATWATPAITGIATPANLVYPILFKHRIFAIEKNTLKVWYLPLDSVQGVAAPLPYGNLMRNGGSLQSITSWTLDAGDGSDDLFAAVSTEGDLVIYQGIDPSSASSWSLIGVWNVGRPVGRRCFQKVAGDVVLITENGVFPLSRVLKSGSINFTTALSNKIQAAFTSIVTSVGITTEGWEATVYPQYDALIINIPPGSSTAGQQFVMSTVTGAWCSFSGWIAYCFQVYQGTLYFGGTGGIVKSAWGTLTSDSGTDIVGTGFQAYNYFGQRTQLKQVKVFRPLLSYDGTVQQTWGVSQDYAEIRLSSTVARGSSAVGTAWDAGAWDTFAWAGSVTAAKLWKAASHAPGFALSLRLQLTSNNGSVSWFGTDYILQGGGMM